MKLVYAQMALILEEKRVSLYNILSKSWEPEALAVATAGKQWLCTPCRTALLAVRHNGTLGRWLLDAYSLEDGGTAQPLFWQILKDADLPPGVASLPCAVRSMPLPVCTAPCPRVLVVVTAGDLTGVK